VNSTAGTGAAAGGPRLQTDWDDEFEEPQEVQVKCLKNGCGEEVGGWDTLHRHVQTELADPEQLREHQITRSDMLGEHGAQICANCELRCVGAMQHFERLAGPREDDVCPEGRALQHYFAPSAADVREHHPADEVHGFEVGAVDGYSQAKLQDWCEDRCQESGYRHEAVSPCLERVLEQLYFGQLQRKEAPSAGGNFLSKGDHGGVLVMQHRLY
jgi:hypothetical protein